ncbi:MAG: substrate-binding domain-containing protein [Chloroflexota bacterium]
MHKFVQGKLNRHLSRRQVLKGMAATSATLFLAACAPGAAPSGGGDDGGASEPTEIVWHTRTGRNEEFYTGQAEIYHEVQDAIRVKIEATPNAEYQQKLATLAAGAELGDSYWGNVFGQLYPFASAGIALDVTPLLEADPWWDADNYFSIGIEQITVDDKLIGLPMSGHPGWTTLYTNVTAMEEKGLPLPEWEWSYQDPWLDVMKEATSEEQFGYMFDYNAQNTYNFIRSWGGDWVDEERKQSTLLSDEAVDAMAFMRSLVEEHGVSPTREQIVNDAFLNEFTATWSHGIWYYGTGLRTIEDKFEWRGFPVPSGPGGQRGSFIGCDTFCINSQGDNIDAAFEWGKFLMSKEARLAAVKGGAPAPFLKEAWEDPFLSEDPTFQAMLQWLEVAQPWSVPANARALEFRNTFNQAISVVLDPDADFMGELENLNAAIQGVLDKPTI